MKRLAKKWCRSQNERNVASKRDHLVSEADDFRHQTRQNVIWRFPKVGLPPNHPFEEAFPITNHPCGVPKKANQKTQTEETWKRWQHVLEGWVGSLCSTLVVLFLMSAKTVTEGHAYIDDTYTPTCPHHFPNAHAWNMCQHLPKHYKTMAEWKTMLVI